MAVVFKKLTVFRAFLAFFTFLKSYVEIILLAEYVLCSAEC